MCYVRVLFRAVHERENAFRLFKTGLFYDPFLALETLFRNVLDIVKACCHNMEDTMAWSDSSSDISESLSCHLTVTVHNSKSSWSHTDIQAFCIVLYRLQLFRLQMFIIHLSLHQLWIFKDFFCFVLYSILPWTSKNFFTLLLSQQKWTTTIFTSGHLWLDVQGIEYSCQVEVTWHLCGYTCSIVYQWNEKVPHLTWKVGDWIIPYTYIFR